jgi:hypothetical protein
MVSVMVFSWFWVKIDPIFIVSWDSHFGGVSVVHIFGAAKIFRRIITMRIINVRIIHKTLPILRMICTSPLSSETLLSLCFRHKTEHAEYNCTNCCKQNFTYHFNSIQYRSAKLFKLFTISFANAYLSNVAHIFTLLYQAGMLRP